jgi:hypothetical protein
MKKSHELFKRHCCLNVWLHKDFISHEKSAHHLQDWDFKWEVERSNHCNWSIRPSVASGKLSLVITRRSISAGKVADIITTEIFEEIDSDFEFTECLLLTFRACSLDAVNKEVPDFIVLHGLNDLSANLTKHKVSLLILEWIV